MRHDPTDERYRKPRQFRNTPARKYVNGFSAAVTLLYLSVMYYSLKRDVFPYLNDEKYQNKLSEDEKAMAEDYSNPILRGVIDRLQARKVEKLKAEAESKNIHTD